MTEKNFDSRPPREQLEIIAAERLKKGNMAISHSFTAHGLAFSFAVAAVVALITQNYLREDHTVTCKVSNDSELAACFKTFDTTKAKVGGTALNIVFEPR